jgi:hypothetical protein
VGETIAHLVYLQERGRVRTYTEDETIYYALA